MSHSRLNFVTKRMEPLAPFWGLRFPRVLLSAWVVLFMVGLALSAVFGVVVYRMSMVAALASFKYVTTYKKLIISGDCYKLLFRL